MLLAFDTATEQVTAAIHDGQQVRAQASSDRPMKHAEQLAPLIEAVMTQAGCRREDLDAIAVGVGPGPFTGLRVGLVTARTLAHVLGIEVQGVCSLDILAQQHLATASERGEFMVATDARRKEVYYARYDAAGRRTCGPAVARPAEVAEDGLVIGAGAVLYPEHFPNAAAPVLPEAGWLASAVVAGQVEILPPEPLYLRRPDAVAPGKPKSTL